MFEIWNKDIIHQLLQSDLEDWFDVLNNGLVEDRGFSLSDPNIDEIRQEIKQDYLTYITSLVDDKDFYSYYVYRNEIDKIVSVSRIVKHESKYFLEGLETHRDYYQKGYSTKLVESVIQNLSRDNIEIIYSKVRNHNKPSFSFHLKFGFSEVESDTYNTIFSLNIDMYLRKILFNNWSSTYNKSVEKSDKENTYPFAGYSKIQDYIFNRCREIPNAKILEMGIGTGLMTYKLYGLEYNITGVDLSEKMIEEAKKLMPLNKYILSDFKSVDDKLGINNYDIIIFSYSIHHMKPINQKWLLDNLSNRLSDNGLIIIGDVLTSTNEEMKKIAIENENIWDDEEYYPTYETYLNPVLKQHYEISFKPISFCSGVMELRKK